MRDKLSYDKPF